MLLSILFAYLVVWLPREVLPDNASKLWLKAHYTWLLKGDRDTQNNDLLSVTERRENLRGMFRNFANICMPLVKEQIDRNKKFIKDYECSTDPEIQATVRFSRKHLADKEEDMKWYQQLLEIPDRGPIVLPRR